ncbi:efflux transporter outer membrane subunit [Sulfuriroseicoccus oceanibius]|uniref:Efflux transporter outer membrane subunit n=1 Tax=Sulfuriroseicoccus oceanibius TaxID=2707525 RepID=A0A6B3L8L7_9BACT|nr:efflux transporter outer membrane subunit [Sulfuriroseicoccus oceanibius]QQL46169.1 efflux transporter outer membrane subunit [Sulfuriroseicoccus oceanibius]
MLMKSYLLGAASLTMLVGCASLPGSFSDSRDPSTTLPEGFDVSQAAVPDVAESLLGIFKDSKLEALVNAAWEANPDLQASAARMEEAGFNLKKAGAPLFPSLTGNAGARTGERLGVSSDTFNATLDTRWEVDVWGKLRAGRRAGAANFAEAKANYEAAKQSIAAQAMQGWFDLVAAEQLLDLAQRRAASFEKSYQLVNTRFENGTTGIGDVHLAKVDLELARAAVQLRTNERDQAARNVRVLAGLYPDAQLRTGAKLPSLSRSVKAGVPSDVLLNRPDIDAAYQAIRAADERVTVAHRDLFPSFVLTGSGGRESSTLGDLAKSGFDVWSFGASLAAPLFEGGARRAELGAAGKRAEQAYFRYQKVVLDAFREVENSLGSERYLARQLSATEAALEAARRAETKSRSDYEQGLVEILNLLISQRQVFSTEESAIQLRAARAKNRVSLALALGKAY